MAPEFWVGIAAVFVSGGAIGAAGTLLSQWLLRRLSHEPTPPEALDYQNVAMLRQDLADLALHVENLDARLDFQEQLLGGATPTTHPPARLAPGESDEA